MNEEDAVTLCYALIVLCAIWRVLLICTDWSESYLNSYNGIILPDEEEKQVEFRQKWFGRAGFIAYIAYAPIAIWAPLFFLPFAAGISLVVGFVESHYVYPNNMHHNREIHYGYLAFETLTIAVIAICAAYLKLH